eukprot:scaffold46291_cov67-Phaeocystis_antarctica.AAC.1
MQSCCNLRHAISNLATVYSSNNVPACSPRGQLGRLALASAHSAPNGAAAGRVDDDDGGRLSKASVVDGQPSVPDRAHRRGRQLHAAAAAARSCTLPRHRVLVDAGRQRHRPQGHAVEVADGHQDQVQGGGQGEPHGAAAAAARWAAVHCGRLDLRSAAARPLHADALLCGGPRRHARSVAA